MSRRVGRPAVQRDPNERVPIATRLRGSLYNELIEEAARNDRPLGNEVELRIETTFRDEDTFDQVMTLRYGPTLSVALEVIGRATLKIGQYATSPQTWVDRFDLGEHMSWAAHAVFAALQGREHPPQPQDPFALTSLAIVGGLLYAIRFPERVPHEQRHRAQSLHDKLGPEGVARLRVPPFVRAQIGPDGNLTAQLIDGDEVTDLPAPTPLPPARRHMLRFDADGAVTAQSFDGDEVTVTTIPPARRHAAALRTKISGKG